MGQGMGTKANDQIDATEARRLGRVRGTLHLEANGRGVQLTPSFRGSLQVSLFIDTLIIAQVTVDKDSRLQVFRGYVLHQGAAIHLFGVELELVAAYVAGFYGDAP